MITTLNRWFPTTDRGDLTREQLEHSKFHLLTSGLCTQVMETLTVTTFLVAYALLLGADNLTIGLLTAAPNLANVAQFAGMALVEKYRNRRVVSVLAGLCGRPLLLLLPLCAFIPNSEVALALMIVITFIRFSFGAVMQVSWIAWMRDLIPGEERGRFFGKRTRLMMVSGMIMGLAAGWFVDAWPELGLGEQKFAFSAVFGVAAVAGLMSSYFLAKVYEPRMMPASGDRNLVRMLREPFRDRNYRNVLGFVAAWNFAHYLALPFFTVHMLQRLGLDVFTVTVLLTISELSNIAVLSIVGALTDRFSAKSVLRVATPLFIICIFAWTFTSRPAMAESQLVLLVLIHIGMGIAKAGVTVGTTTVTMRLAPDDQATSYLTSYGLVAAVAAGFAPVVGGLTAEFFVSQSLSVAIIWEGFGDELAADAIRLENWDFFFFFAVLFGIYALRRLAAVEEEGTVSERQVVREFVTEAARSMQSVAELPVTFIQRRRRPADAEECGAADDRRGEGRDRRRQSDPNYEGVERRAGDRRSGEPDRRQSGLPDDPSRETVDKAEEDAPDDAGGSGKKS